MNRTGVRRFSALDRWSLLCALALLQAPALSAQEKPRQPAPDEVAAKTRAVAQLVAGYPCPILCPLYEFNRAWVWPEIFWEEPERARPAAAVQLVAAYHPISLWPVLQRQRWLVWHIPDEPPPLFDGKFAPTLDPALLRCLAVLDARPVPSYPPRDLASADFFKLLSKALFYCKEVPVEAFVAWGKENAHVTFGHLYNDPKRYYGKVVRLEGNLLRVRKYELPDAIRRASGVDDAYEAWLQGPTSGSHPFSVLFTRLPEGIEVAEKIKDGTYVEFYGYFLGRIKFRGGDSKDRITPYIVGPTIQTKTAPPIPPSAGSSLSGIVFYGVLGIVIVSVALMTGLNWWFRRGDQQVRLRLAQIQAEKAVQALEAGAVPPEPGAPADGFWRDEPPPPQTLAGPR